jgi:hypothetical protein
MYRPLRLAAWYSPAGMLTMDLVMLCMLFPNLRALILEPAYLALKYHFAISRPNSGRHDAFFG